MANICHTEDDPANGGHWKQPKIIITTVTNNGNTIGNDDHNGNDNNHSNSSSIASGDPVCNILSDTDLSLNTDYIGDIIYDANVDILFDTDLSLNANVDSIDNIIYYTNVNLSNIGNHAASNTYALAASGVPIDDVQINDVWIDEDNNHINNFIDKIDQDGNDFKGDCAHEGDCDYDQVDDNKIDFTDSNNNIPIVIITPYKDDCGIFDGEQISTNQFCYTAIRFMITNINNTAN